MHYVHYLFIAEVIIRVRRVAYLFKETCLFQDPEIIQTPILAERQVNIAAIAGNPVVAAIRQPA